MGKSVKIRRGPATVNNQVLKKFPLSNVWMGEENHDLKPGNLP